MHAHNILHRHSEHPVGVVVTQVVLGGEWQLVQIVETLDILGVNVGQYLTVKRYPLLGPALTEAVLPE